jgi:hypothetical protein
VNVKRPVPCILALLLFAAGSSGENRLPSPSNQKDDHHLESTKYQSFQPGKIWADNHNVHINAHGGGILYHQDKYYWYGEHKVAGNAGNLAQVGVHCYSSTDMYNWTDEGIALKVVEDNPESPIAKGCVLETSQGPIQPLDEQICDVVPPRAQEQRIWRGVKRRGGQ